MQQYNADNLCYRIAFASLRGMGYDLAQKILGVIPSEKDYFEMSEKELQSLLQTKVKITEQRYRAEQLEKAYQKQQKEGNARLGAYTYHGCGNCSYPLQLRCPDILGKRSYRTLD